MPTDFLSTIHEIYIEKESFHAIYITNEHRIKNSTLRKFWYFVFRKFWNILA